MEKEQAPQYEIRKATLDDVEAIRRMHAQSWLATYPNDENNISYEWVKEWVNTWLTPEKIEESKQIVGDIVGDPSQFHRIATMAEKIVGFIHILTKDDGTKELEAIYTDPESFGTGLGSQLMAEGDKWIDGAKTTLTVVSYNDRAIKFYERHGFKKVEGSEFIYGDKLPAMRMIREGKEL